jgi:hypothetical protein
MLETRIVTLLRPGFRLLEYSGSTPVVELELITQEVRNERRAESTVG